MNKKLTAIIASVAVIAACVVLVVFVRGGSSNELAPDVEQTPETLISQEDIPSDSETSSVLEDITEDIKEISEKVSEAVSSPAPDAEKESLKKDTEKSTSVQKNTPETGLTTESKKEETTAEKSPEETTVLTSSGTLPDDMTLKGLHKLGYDSWGTKKYIYNNDKDCAQSKFGYNRFYDKAAPLADFHIVTCRIPFKNYDNKDWMVQLWKGTYITGDIGTVGCEIGLYNRTAGKYGGMFDHYNCAPESDWLDMEMTLLWDEEYDGNYKAQFTRTYGKYWWPTGFVDGQLKNVNDTSCLRVLGRITFKDSHMADLFEAALAGIGFRKVSTFDPTVKDTYKRQICDVIFCWQDIRN